MVARIDGCIEISEGKRPSVAAEMARFTRLLQEFGTEGALQRYFACHSGQCPPADPLACPEEWAHLFGCDDAIRGECSETTVTFPGWFQNPAYPTCTA
jgi:hypothetical protein